MVVSVNDTELIGMDGEESWWIKEMMMMCEQEVEIAMTRSDQGH